MTGKKLTLYYTEACHLCELAKSVFKNVARKQQAVDNLNWSMALVDIANDEALFKKYGLHIPVIEVDGHEIGWPFDEAELDNFLLSLNTN